MQVASVERKDLLNKNGVNVVRDTGATNVRWNPQIKQAIEILGYNLWPGQEVQIECTHHNLLVAKCKGYYSVINEGKLVLEHCESIKVLPNGWIVACKGRGYTVYYKDGSKYNGLTFASQRMAIRFATKLK